MNRIAAIAAITSMLSITIGAGQISAAPPIDQHDTLTGDALTAPAPAASTRSALPAGSTDDLPVSAFMAGKIAVRLVFVESNGSQEASTEDWTEAQRAGIEGQVRAGLSWWEARVPNAHASFTVVSQLATTGYEPITHGLADEHLWASQALASLGFAGSDHFTQAYNADNAIRDQLGTDWATTIFFINSTNDADGRFSDNYFAYAYVNGPFMVITSDASTYGFSRLPVVVSHELGHIFGALDQYDSAKVPCTMRGGYLGVASTNSQYGQCGTKNSSIMLEPVSAYPAGAVDESALGQIGYRDSDGDDIPDPLDTQPSLTVTISPINSVGVRPLITARAIDHAFPSPLQTSVSINTIDRIEYRTDGSSWAPLPQTNGAFDRTEEALQAELPLYDGTQTIELRAVNRTGETSPILSQTLSIVGVGAKPFYSVESAPYINTSDLPLNIQADMGTEIRVSDRLDFPNAPWRRAGSVYTYTLGTCDDGQQTIYIALRDTQGRQMPIITRQFTVDHTAPLGVATAAGQEIIIQAEDKVSGLDAMQVLFDDTTASSWEAFTPTFVMNTQQTPKAIILRDHAGNVSAPIIIDSSHSIFLPLVTN